MAAWAGEQRTCGPARLDGFRLEFRRRSRRWQAGAADVVPTPDAAVWGVLWVLDETALQALDRKESVAAGGYRRRSVTVVGSAGPTEAVTYEVVDKTDRELAPSAAYLDLLVGAATSAGLPATYVAELQTRGQQLGSPTGHH